MAALVAPFSRDALGAQVPDMYSFPTETDSVKTEFSIFPDENGNLDFTIMPSLFQTIVCSNPATLVTQVNTSATIGGVAVEDFRPDPTWGVNYSANGMVQPANVNSTFQQYRIVGWGVRIRSLTAPIYQAGRLLFSVVPSNEVSFPSRLAGPYQKYDDLLEYCNLPGVDQSGYLTTQIINVPDSTEIMLSDLSMQGGLEFVAKPTTTGNVAFRDSINDIVVSAQAGLYEGQVVNNVANTRAFQFAVGSLTASSSSFTTNFGQNLALYVGAVGAEFPFGAYSGEDSVHVGMTFPNPPDSANPAQGFYEGGIGRPITITAVTQSNERNFATYVMTIGSVAIAIGTTVIPSGSTAIAATTNNSGAVVGVAGRSLLGCYLQQSQAQLYFGTPNVCITGVAAAGVGFGFSRATAAAIPASTALNFFDLGAGLPGNPLLVNFSTDIEKRASAVSNGAMCDVYAAGGNNLSFLDRDYYAIGGWESMCCRGYGLPQSSQGGVAQPCLSVEVIMHIEGSPAVGEAGTLFNAGKKPTVAPGMMQAAIQAACELPFFHHFGGSDTHGVATAGRGR